MTGDLERRRTMTAHYEELEIILKIFKGEKKEKENRSLQRKDGKR